MNLILFLVFLFDRWTILISVLFVDRDMIEQDRQPDRGPVDGAGSSNTSGTTTYIYVDVIHLYMSIVLFFKTAIPLNKKSQ
jgi:hypothetical protein